MDLQGMQAIAGAVPAATAETAGMNTIAAVIIALLPALIMLLVVPIIMGMMCRRLARHKGYSGYFWTGFFFNVIGLIYVVGLPDLNTRKDMRAVMKRLVNVSDRVAMLEDQQAK